MVIPFHYYYCGSTQADGERSTGVGRDGMIGMVSLSLYPRNCLTFVKTTTIADGQFFVHIQHQSLSQVSGNYE